MSSPRDRWKRIQTFRRLARFYADDGTLVTAAAYGRTADAIEPPDRSGVVEPDSSYLWFAEFARSVLMTPREQFEAWRRWFGDATGGHWDGVDDIAKELGRDE